MALETINISRRALAYSLDHWAIAKWYPLFFKVAGTLRVPFANVRESLADGTWKVPATF